jgi:hypothetical protein
MRIRSSLFIGLCLSLAACTAATVSEPSGAQGSPENADAPALAEDGNPSNPSEPNEPSEQAEQAAPAPDAGSDPVADAGVDAAKKPVIPAPTTGWLHAYANTGETCEFSIDGVYKSKGTVLDIPLSPDAYVVTCKRANGTTADRAAFITTGTTYNVVFDFQIIPKPVFDAGVPMGNIVGVAVGGSCTFSVDGVVVGSGAAFEKAYPAGTYAVSCKPVSGATKSRSVTVTPPENAMAMFKL